MMAQSATRDGAEVLQGEVLRERVRADPLHDILGDANAIRRFAEHADELTRHLIEGLPHVINPDEFNMYWDSHYELLGKFSEHLGVSHAPGASNDYIPKMLGEHRRAVQDFLASLESNGQGMPDVVDKLANVIERINTLVNNYPLVLDLARREKKLEIGDTKIAGVEQDAKLRAREEAFGEAVSTERGPIEIQAARTRGAVDTASTQLHELENTNRIRRGLSDVQTETNTSMLDVHRLEGEARVQTGRARAAGSMAQADLTLAGSMRQQMVADVALEAMEVVRGELAELVASSARVVIGAERNKHEANHLTNVQKARELRVKDRRHFLWAHRRAIVGIAAAFSMTVVASNTIADNPDTSHFNNGFFQAVNNAWDDVYNPIATQFRSDDEVASDASPASNSTEVETVEEGIPAPAVTPVGEGMEFDDRYQIASRPVNGERITFRCNDGVIEADFPPTQPANIAVASMFVNDPCTAKPGYRQVLIDGTTGAEYRLHGLG